MRNASTKIEAYVETGLVTQKFIDVMSFTESSFLECDKPASGEADRLGLATPVSTKTKTEDMRVVA